MVRVVRVPALPGGVSIFIDDQPDSTVIWVLEGDYTRDKASELEQAFNTIVSYWAQVPGRRQVHLRAV